MARFFLKMNKTYKLYSFSETFYGYENYQVGHLCTENQKASLCSSTKFGFLLEFSMTF